MRKAKLMMSVLTLLALANFSFANVPQAGKTNQSMKSNRAAAQANQQTRKSGQAAGLKGYDNHFMIEAAQGGLMEVELGRIATEKAASPSVKDFGQKMVTDHSKANDELKSLAGQKGVTLPTTLDAKHKAMVDNLAKLSGAQFDKAYMSHMVKDHVKDVADFKQASKKANDADLKSWAGKTVPALESHLTLAQTTQAQVAGTKTTNKKVNAKPAH